VKNICFRYILGDSLCENSQAEAKLCRDAYLHAFICHPDRSVRRSFAVKKMPSQAPRTPQISSLLSSVGRPTRYVSRDLQYCQVVLGITEYNYMTGYWLQTYIFSEFRASSVFLVTVVSVTTYILTGVVALRGPNVDWATGVVAR
jgi:hypothetical protein